MDDIKQFEPLWGSWYVKELIGEGGYGKVYRIERNDYGIKYESALKHIRIPHSKSEVKGIMLDGMDEKSVTSYFENFIGEIVKEFALMSKLRGNSNIVSYEDHKIEKADDKLQWDVFIRMELLTSLVDYISDNEIKKNTIIKLGIDICKALEVCQKHNIIHRDIKPENIFVSENGDFKLGDFGIARQIDKTMAGLSKKGTFTYIAPEVYKGESYGSTVDIYSLGLVMYRLLNNNRMPFMPAYPAPITHNDREVALAKRMSGQELPMPKNAEGRLAEIVLKACSYNSKDRYESPRRMREELENILYSEKEARVIYPEGDRTEIHSVDYINSRNTPMQSKDFSYEDKAMAMDLVPVSEEDETRTMAVNIPPEPEEDETRTMAMNIPSEPKGEDNLPDVKNVKNDSFPKKRNYAAEALAYEERVKDRERAEEREKERKNTTEEKKNLKIHIICGTVTAVVILFIIVGLLGKFGNSNNDSTVNSNKVTEKTAAANYTNLNPTISNVNIAAGDVHSLMRMSDGTVVAAGDNRYNQCDVDDWTDIMAVAAGDHSVGLKSDGTVVAVGNNSDEQCNVDKWTNIVAIYAGGNSTIGLKSDGTVMSAGSYYYSTPDEEVYSGTFELQDWNSITTVAVGSHHVLGVKSDGTVVADGYNGYGACDVDGWTDIVAVAAGFGYSVGLKSDGTVVATGFNEYGQCNVNDWTDITAISAGIHFTVGLKSDGTVVAVGSNVDGQCNVGYWTNIEAISAGGNSLIGLKSDGTIAAAGNNEYGQFELILEEKIITPLNPSHIAVESSFMVGLKKDGTVAVETFGDDSDWKDELKNEVSNWSDIVSVASTDMDIIGLNSNGKMKGENLGDINNWKDIVAISAYGDHILGLKEDGTVICDVPYFEYGEVEGWTDIAAISTSERHSLGVKSDGTVISTGIYGDSETYDFGQTEVDSWTDIVAVAAGVYHSVGIKKDGTVISTAISADKGDVNCGQTAVNSWTDIVTVAVGDYHTVGLKSDGTVVSTSLSEELGINCGQTAVEEWTDIVEIYAGRSYTVGLKSDGTVVTAGEIYYGANKTEAPTWTDIG